MGAADDLSLRLLLTEQVVAELFGDLSPKYTGADLVARFTARFPTHRPVPGGKKLRPFGKTGRRLRQAANATRRPTMAPEPGAERWRLRQPGAGGFNGRKNCGWATSRHGHGASSGR